MSRISVPTAARLQPSVRVDSSNAAVVRILNRLSRPSLLSLALDWLDERNYALASPYLVEEDEDEDEEDDDFYPPLQSLDDLRELYTDLQARKGSKREVVDRMVEGDWRHGLSLYQLAMADLQYLYDHPSSQKWTAYRIVPLKMPSDGDDEDEPLKVDKKSLVVPRFHPSSFLEVLQSQALPDVKAHYHFDRPKNHPLLLLRIFIIDSPYNTDLAMASRNKGRPAANFDSSRTVYIAFPDASPHVYISKSQVVGPAQAGESKSLRSLVVEGIPKALSKPRQRFTLKSTSHSTRNLEEMLEKRGPGRTNAAGGGWGIYADEKKNESPLDTVLPTPPLSDRDDGEPHEQEGGKRKQPLSLGARLQERRAKRAKTVAEARFGGSALINDGKGIERLDIVIEDPYPEMEAPPLASTADREGNDAGSDGDVASPAGARRSKNRRRSALDVDFEQEAATREGNNGGDQEAESDETEKWTPNLRLTFHGTHVFAGLRQLVEHGIINGERMPGWMTGEEGVTIGAVRHGRIRGHKGSGI